MSNLFHFQTSNYQNLISPFYVHYYLHLQFLSFLSVLVYLVFGTTPPLEPNEQDIGHGWTNWSLDTEPIIHGKTIWSHYADNRNQSIKVHYSTYWGGIFHSFESMSWEVEEGVFSTKSLDFYDLLSKWDNSVAVFKFKYNDGFYRVSFSSPKLENGLDKYSSLLEAWEKEELHHIVEKW